MIFLSMIAMRIVCCRYRSFCAAARIRSWLRILFYPFDPQFLDTHRSSTCCRCGCTLFSISDVFLFRLLSSDINSKILKSCRTLGSPSLALGMERLWISNYVNYDYMND